MHIYYYFIIIIIDIIIVVITNTQLNVMLEEGRNCREFQGRGEMKTSTELLVESLYGISFEPGK